VSPATGQARQQVTELRQLDLRLGFAAAGTQGENVEDHRGPIEHFDIVREFTFDVAHLRGGEILVKDD
jgi:hypothetical protein